MMTPLYDTMNFLYKAFWFLIRTWHWNGIGSRRDH